MSRYWLTPAYEAGFDEKVSEINKLYQQAPELAKQAQRVESLDEMTGVQALERKHPDLPMLPGKVERREFEYTGMARCLLHVTWMWSGES